MKICNHQFISYQYHIVSSISQITHVTNHPENGTHNQHITHKIKSTILRNKTNIERKTQYSAPTVTRKYNSIPKKTKQTHPSKTQIPWLKLKNKTKLKA